jgi:UDP-N-acetylmuramoyl-tripeptide--D-alanyl-D-alanine ligase
MILTLRDCQELFPNYRRRSDLNVEINSIATDTRKPMEKALFVPLVGANFDGHAFMKDALNQGAVAAIWQKDKEVPRFLPTEFPLFLVDDTTKALQEMATFILKKQQPIIVAVTGSNGKTTTKDIVEAVLSQKYETHKTIGNFNNHWGLPFTIFEMPASCQCLILEMGMSNYGEISLLSHIANPDFAIVTNIGESHIENLGSREGIAKAKLEIIDGLKANGELIVDGDEPLLRQRLSVPTTYCGYNEDNSIVLSMKNISKTGFTFSANDNEYYLPMLGNHNVKNAAYAIAIGEKLKLTHEEIQNGLNTVNITAMRLETHTGKQDSFIINDSYNASPTSMVAAIETLKQLNDYPRKVLVLGDMYELGSDEEKLHRSVAQSIAPPITELITVGEKGKWIADELKGKQNSIKISSYKTKEEALKTVEHALSPETAILFKASRGLQLETIVKSCLENKGEK